MQINATAFFEAAGSSSWNFKTRSENMIAFSAIW
jgi:hypothetical protein